MFNTEYNDKGDGIFFIILISYTIQTRVRYDSIYVYNIKLILGALRNIQNTVLTSKNKEIVGSPIGRK